MAVNTFTLVFRFYCNRTTTTEEDQNRIKSGKIGHLPHNFQIEKVRQTRISTGFDALFALSMGYKKIFLAIGSKNKKTLNPKRIGSNVVLAGAEGIEPSARGFGDHCSTG